MFQTSGRRSHLHLLCPVTHLNDSRAAFGCSFNRQHQLKFNTGAKTGTLWGISLLIYLFIYIPLQAFPCWFAFWPRFVGLNCEAAVWMEQPRLRGWPVKRTTNKSFIHGSVHTGGTSRQLSFACTRLHKSWPWPKWCTFVLPFSCVK